MANAVVIVERTSGKLRDKRIVLNQSQVLRGMGIGNSWGHIRIGVMASMYGPLVTITNSPHFYIGVNSGTAAGPLSNPSSHFIGTRWNDGFMQYSTYGVANNNHWIIRNDKVEGYKHVGGVETASFIDHSSYGIHAIDILGEQAQEIGEEDERLFSFTDPGPGVSYFFTDLEKIGPTTMRISTAGARRDQPMGMTFDDFRSAMTVADVTSFDGFGTTNGTNTPVDLAFDEVSDGALDSICIAWDQDYDMELSLVAFARLG